MTLYLKTRTWMYHHGVPSSLTWLRYFPAKKVWYPAKFFSRAGKVCPSSLFCQTALLQFPSSVLLMTWWLCGYLPVRMLARLGQHSGLATNWWREGEGNVSRKQEGRIKWCLTRDVRGDSEDTHCVREGNPCLSDQFPSLVERSLEGQEDLWIKNTRNLSLQPETNI